ncbi:hypothetical protein DRO61_03875 [Candidatus Bathyarchaeota archaeon]|nr:MAG: hypothetical protein DRO61_03875 [Candidatus Bathyarchaeota archaeon]
MMDVGKELTEIAEVLHTASERKMSYNLGNHYNDSFGVMQKNLINKKNLRAVVDMIGELKIKNPADPVYADLYEKISRIEI